MVVKIMAEDIFQSITRRTDYLYSLVDAKRTDPASQAFALDVLEGLQSAARLRDHLARACKLLWKEAFDNVIEDYDVTGKIFLTSLKVALQAFEAVRSRARDARSTSVADDIAPQFDEAMKALEQATADVQNLSDDFSKHWPWFSEKKLSVSIAEEQQGTRRRSAKEVFDELRRRVR